MKIPRRSLNERRVEIDLSLYPPESQMRSKLTSTALVSDRFGVSDRATAVIASSVLYHLGMISEEDTSLGIDKIKIRREKDNTIFQEKIGTNIYRRIGKEEHISVIREPSGRYVRHVTPASGTGSDIAKSIRKCMEDNDVDINELEAIGCDGSATNTGWKKWCYPQHRA
ncbi:hypothetical protein AVEN_198781-1 [Araneus ventricosus]|uniref:DUF4371 domain-containing protein n=1 Tax=Araneus ventricosus TaxID=182803 RepID=A0A4Y2X6G1_ARAVE|nr:hypothetical protein AVEN_137238-1 [Araneus ventricosus]GBO44431.1 hypothetical protein AVEN_198781-1 [Araneus ventricosus]